jgi:hypothetical protein
MDGINALIASGGGYRPPGFDLQTAQGNAMALQNQGMKNQLLQQDVEARPAERKLNEEALHLRGMALDLREQALKSVGKEEMINVDSGDVTFSGRPEDVARVADMVGRYPDQANDPGFIPWVAEQRVSIKKKEAKNTGMDVGKTRTFQKGNAEVTQEWDGRKWNDIGSGPKWNPDKTGMKVYDKEGNLIVDTGGGPPLTKPTQGKIEDKILSGKEQIARMEAIAKEFKPEYQQTGTRLQAAWTGIKAKLGKNVSPEDAKSLTGFKQYQRKSIENINLYIKEFTGAQMSEQEASRLRLAQPDPGEHWWQGDDPITFKGKVDDVIKASRAVVARYEYYRATGMNDAQIRDLINKNKAIPLEALMANMEK